MQCVLERPVKAGGAAVHWRCGSCRGESRVHGPTSLCRDCPLAAVTVILVRRQTLTEPHVVYRISQLDKWI